jgi:C4-dicarboxylate-binding protein DctP
MKGDSCNETQKTLSLIFALGRILSLAACSSNSGSTAAETPAASAPAETPAASEPAAPAGDTAAPAESYVFSFASSKATGSNRNVMVEEVLKSKLEEASGGRITIEIYPSNTLVGAKEMLDALNNGTADMGYFIGNMFPGQFPYTELLGTPGLKYSSISSCRQCHP